jgi:hypothetical protein
MSILSIPNFNLKVINKEARLGDDIDFGKFEKLRYDLYIRLTSLSVE